MKIIEQKKELRTQFKVQREQLGAEQIKQKSQIIEKKLLNWSVLKNVKNIMCYVSKDTEVATHHLIKTLLQMNKIVAVPLIIKKGLMKPVVIHDFAQLVVADFKTLQPQTNYSLDEKIDLKLVPALAVSQKGDRLGWGAGFYDRFISKYQPQFNVALIFDCQLVDQLPTTEFDQKLDGAISESKLISF